MGSGSVDHTIVFVDELPDEHKFLLIEEPDRVTVVYQRSAVCPEVLEESWAAYRTLRRGLLLAPAG